MASVNQTPTTSKVKRAVLYRRVSSTQQSDGSSLDTQEADGQAYSAKRGYTVIEDFREVASGALFHERPQLTALRALVRRSGVDVVVCYSVDRLSRNQAHLYILAEECENAGVKLEFVTESFEDTAVGKFLRSAKACAAEIEREKFRDRSLRGRRARVQSGKLIHGETPMYGYHWDDVEDKARYIENAVTAPIVRRMFAEMLEGGTLRGIASRLTDDDIPTPRNARVWDFTTVGHILREGRYAGDAFAFRIRHWKVAGKAYHEQRPREEWLPLPEGTIPPLIDRATFEAVQARLAKNQSFASRRLSEPETFLLRGGIARCGYCGCALAASWQTTRGNRFAGYFCAARERGPIACGCHRISARILDGATWARVEAVLTQPDIIAGEIEGLRRDDPTRGDLASIDQALTDTVRRRGNFSRRVPASDDDEAAAPLLVELANLAKQRRQLETERLAVAARQDGWQAAQSRLDDIQSWCRDVAGRLGTLTYEQKRFALEALGVQVQVWRSDHNPRYLITASIPLDDPDTSQGRHMTRLYVESQNHHSYRLLMT